MKKVLKTKPCIKSLSLLLSMIMIFSLVPAAVTPFSDAAYGADMNVIDSFLVNAASSLSASVNRWEVMSLSAYEMYTGRDIMTPGARQDYMKICDSVDKLPDCRQKLIKYLQLQIETIAKYKSNVTDFRNEFANNNSEISIKIVEAVHSIIFSQLEFVYNIIKKGIGTGEFKNLNPYTATVCFMGSINFYLGMRCFGSELPETEMFQHVGSAENENSLLDCIFNGLLA